MVAPPDIERGSRMEQARTIWIDGALVDWADARVHLVSNTLHYGFNVFEGIRAYETARGSSIFRLDAHIDRLLNSARIIGLAIPYGRDELIEACLAAVRANEMERCYIRPIAYIGEGGMGLDYRDCKVSVAVAVWYWGEYLGAGKLASGISVRTSAYMRHHVATGLTKAKTGANYTLFQMTRTEALRDGYDEALLLDQNGSVAEGSVENIFMVRDGALVTPPLTYILDGITRDTVMRIARDAGIPVREEFFPRDTVYLADEIFFCGTGAEITPVVEVDGRAIGGGKPGPVTQRLQRLYFETVSGRRPDYAHWLTLVGAHG
jgi:branched-chain amino acid aminotransferase